LKTCGVINCGIFGSKNRKFQHFNTCAILPVNTSHQNDVIVVLSIEDKILIKAPRKEKGSEAKKLTVEFPDEM